MSNAWIEMFLTIMQNIIWNKRLTISITTIENKMLMAR